MINSNFISVILVSMFLSCHPKQAIKTTKNIDFGIKSEIYFNDCNSYIKFLQLLFENNRSITYNGIVNTPCLTVNYEIFKKLFQEDCFIGLTKNEIENIFGEGSASSYIYNYRIMGFTVETKKHKLLGIQFEYTNEIVTNCSIYVSSFNSIQ